MSSILRFAFTSYIMENDYESKASIDGHLFGGNL